MVFDPFRTQKSLRVPAGVMATECRHSSEMAVEEQETIIMNRAMKKKEVRRLVRRGSVDVNDGGYLPLSFIIL